MAEVYIGKVKFFCKKGYGFIGLDDGRDFFVHCKDVVEGHDGENYFCKNERVTFELKPHPKGDVAINVKLVKEDV